MLNVNQPKKRKSWKHYVVIPALVAFVLLFQIEVVAKEKESKTKTVSTEIESVNFYQIKKNSTDKDLKTLKESLKSLHNVDLEISRIKRNSEDELTSIKVYVRYENQKSQSIQTSGKETIKDLGIVVVTGKNGAKRTSIKTYDEETANVQSTVTDSKDAKKNTALQLIIVNGIEMPASFDYNTIDPSTIESVNVLKGTEATGQYGDKGVNGVIEIETKK